MQKRGYLNFKQLQKRLVTPYLIFALCAWGNPAAASTALSFSSANNGFVDSISRMLGWQFTVNNSVKVTELGWQDFGSNGLVFDHEVGIWNKGTQALLGSAVIPGGSGSPLTNFFRYVSAPSGITLDPGTTYVIAGFDHGNGDPHVWDVLLSGFNDQVNGFSTDLSIQLGPAGTAFGPIAAAFSFPTTAVGDTRRALMGPNFQFAPVPLPTAIWLLGSALGGLSFAHRRITI